ncbi:hypothetical protein DOY81_013690 [Sarcophaga bullata]|nr:hypothetical protein DOY81_013690 [Sarcophaga bullata]
MPNPTSGPASFMPSHPQTSYCQADYVIVVRVLRKSTRLVPQHTAL